MNDYELVVTTSKFFEHYLRDELGGTGIGLHELAESVADQLPGDFQRHIHLIAAVRNRLCHEWGYDAIQDREGFLRAVDAAKSQLDQSAATTTAASRPIVYSRRSGQSRHPVRLYLVLSVMLIIAILRGTNFQFPVPDVLKFRPYSDAERTTQDQINDPGPYGPIVVPQQRGGKEAEQRSFWLSNDPSRFGHVVPIGEPRPADNTETAVPQPREGTGSGYSRFGRVNDPGRYGGLVPTADGKPAKSLDPRLELENATRAK